MWLHCYTCTPQSMLGEGQDNLLLVATNWTVALPHGTQNSWNAGPCCGYAQANGLNDTGFVGQVARSLQERGHWPIMLGGFSNGGFLTAKLAQSEWSGLFDGFVMLSGHQVLHTVQRMRD